MTKPSTVKEWFAHLKAQLAGEAEPVEDDTGDDDWYELPPVSRRD